MRADRIRKKIKKDDFTLVCHLPSPFPTLVNSFCDGKNEETKKDGKIACQKRRKEEKWNEKR